MDLTPTLILLALAAACFLWGRYKSAKPHEPGKLPLISPIALMYISAIFAFYLLIHLAALAGFSPSR